MVPRRLRDPPEPPFFKIFGAKISIFHDFGSENRRNIGRVWRLVFTPQTKKKMASAPPCISYFGGAFRQAEYQPLAFTSKLNKKNGERSALYFLLWGEPFGRQSTSHSLLLQNSTTKKWRALRPVFLALGGASPQAEYWPRRPQT